jgi:SHAQKYF class myb-like DNA-binding protein
MTTHRNSKTNGRWTSEEHRLFIEGLAKYGKDWKKIEDHIKTRDGAQIRSHAQKFFLRMTKEYKRMMKTGKYTEKMPNFNLESLETSRFFVFLFIFDRFFKF